VRQFAVEICGATDMVCRLRHSSIHRAPKPEIMTSAEKHQDEITGYLLGELSAEARAALEARYFDDDDFFAQISERERDLIDDYIHGRLAASQRQQFERLYLNHPDRRARLRFGAALTTALAEQASTPTPTWGERLRAALPTFNPPLALAAGLAMLILALGGVWIWRETQRLRQDLQAARLEQAGTDKRTSTLQAELTAQLQRNQELSAELERLRAQQSTTAPLASEVVSLLFSVGASRASETGRPPELNLTSGVKQVRLKLPLKKNEYVNYQVTVEQVGGSVIWTQKNLRHKSSLIEIPIPASRFTTGDYLLILSGNHSNGELDELAKPFFRVRKQ
jgi:hypothetical protein